MMKRGMFGCDLAQQVTVIGFTYCAISIIMITCGFLMNFHPEHFSEKAKIYEPIKRDNSQVLDALFHTENLTQAEEETQLLSNGTVNETEPETYNLSKEKIQYIKNEGIEMIIGFLMKLICSLLLVQGTKTGRHWYLLPWLVVETIELVGGFIQFAITFARSQNWSATGLALGLFFFILSGYFLYSVASLYSILRRRKNNADLIVQSVSQGVGGFQVGLNYQRLEEECWQPEPNLATEFPARLGSQKKVNQEDEGDEHVLYVQ